MEELQGKSCLWLQRRVSTAEALMPEEGLLRGLWSLEAPGQSWGWAFWRETRPAQPWGHQPAEVGQVVAHQLLLQDTTLQKVVKRESAWQNQGRKIQKALAQILLPENGGFIATWVLPHSSWEASACPGKGTAATLILHFPETLGAPELSSAENTSPHHPEPHCCCW